MTTTTSNTTNNRPPCKHQATILDYDLDQSAEYPQLSTTNIINSPSSPSTLTAAMISTMMTTGYASELLSLKTDINQLKTIITNAVEQIMNAIASLQATNSRVMSSAMDMDVEISMNVNAPNEPHNHHHDQLDLPAIIKEIKTDIATITQEMRAMFQNYLPPKSNTSTPSSLVT